MKLSRLAFVAASLALLAACGGDAPADDGRAAAGEVLDGTISDAMIPTDRVRSEAPLAAPEPATGGPGGAGPDTNPTSAVEGEAPAEGEVITPLDLTPAPAEDR